jgi:hypothetical protein
MGLLAERALAAGLGASTNERGESVARTLRTAHTFQLKRLGGFPAMRGSCGSSVLGTDRCSMSGVTRVPCSALGRDGTGSGVEPGWQGFLFTVAFAPDMVMPSEWLPMIFGDAEPPFHSDKEAETRLPADCAAVVKRDWWDPWEADEKAWRYIPKGGCAVGLSHTGFLGHQGG